MTPWPDDLPGLSSPRAVAGGWLAWEAELAREVLVRPAPPRVVAVVHPAVEAVHRVEGGFLLVAAPRGPTLAEASPPRRARRGIARDVLQALAALHAAGEVHGAVGPAAVQVAASGAILAGALGVGSPADDLRAARQLVHRLGQRCGPADAAAAMGARLRPARRLPVALGLVALVSVGALALRRDEPAPPAALPEALSLDLDRARPAEAPDLTGWWATDDGSPSPALIVSSPAGGWWFARSDAPPGTPPGPRWYLHAGRLWPARQGDALFLRGWLYNQPGWAQGHEIYVEFQVEGEDALLMTRSLFCEPGGPFKFGFQNGHFQRIAPGMAPWDAPLFSPRSAAVASRPGSPR